MNEHKSSGSNLELSAWTQKLNKSSKSINVCGSFDTLDPGNAAILNTYN